MGLNLVPRLGEFFERIKSLEKKVRDLEQGSANSSSRPSRGFSGVMGVLNEDLVPGMSATINVQGIDGEDFDPVLTETVWLPDADAAETIPDGTFVYAYNGYYGTEGRFVVHSEICEE